MASAVAYDSVSPSLDRFSLAGALSLSSSCPHCLDAEPLEVEHQDPGHTDDPAGHAARREWRLELPLPLSLVLVLPLVLAPLRGSVPLLPPCSTLSTPETHGSLGPFRAPLTLPLKLFLLQKRSVHRGRHTWVRS